MGLLNNLRTMLFAASALLALSATTQSSQPPAPRNPSRQKIISFSDQKAVLGLPPGTEQSLSYCTVEGTTFFNARSNSFQPAAPPPTDVYGVLPNGSVKHLRRMIPDGYNSVVLSDFYASEHILVTLLEAGHRDERSGTVEEKHYFIATTDLEGDAADLLPLDIRFKPFRLAAFGSGDFLVLGWDEANQLPVLARVRANGTVRRFVDMETSPAPKPNNPQESSKEKPPSEQVTLKSLQGAIFAPFGDNVLLTYPGTTKAIKVLSDAGDDRTIPIAYPGGFLLHDVLSPDSRNSVVLRLQAAHNPDKNATSHPEQRLFEFSAYSGVQIQEFVLDKTAVESVTCAAANTLTAIFYGPVPGAPSDTIDPSRSLRNSTTQLVVATAPR